MEKIKKEVKKMNGPIIIDENTIKYTKVFEDGSIVRIFYHIERNELTFKRTVQYQTYSIWLMNNGLFKFELSQFTKKGMLTKEDQMLQQQMKNFVKEAMNDLKKNKTYRIRLIMDIHPKKIMDIIYEE